MILLNGVASILKWLFPKKESALCSMWERTHNLHAHKPKFKIACRHCDSKMMLRFTEVYTERYMTFGIKQAVNVVEYKCPRCSLTQKFFVEDDPHYLMDILDLRDGIRMYLPPKKEWEKESKEIRKRLKLLGYM